MTLHPELAPSKAIHRPACSQLNCSSLADIIVADGIGLCGTHAIAWLRRERVR